MSIEDFLLPDGLLAQLEYLPFREIFQVAHARQDTPGPTDGALTPA